MNQGITEVEAKERWCPMVRKYFSKNDDFPAEGPCNMYEGERVGECCASDCMMWRWDNSERDTGFCGLGGK
jgi:hypothetical protein